MSVSPITISSKAAFSEIARRLNPHVKILAASGHADSKKAEEAKTFADAFLLKPFKAEALLQAVKSLLHPTAATAR